MSYRYYIIVHYHIYKHSMFKRFDVICTSFFNFQKYLAS